MNKTIKRNVVVSAILAIMLCVSLIAGATFALFTSESKTNIAVTSGKVNVTATVENERLSSTLASGNLAQTSVSYDDEAQTVTLNKIVPGDTVTFDIKIHNDSDISVKYRTIIACESDNGLFSGLRFSIDREEFTGRTSVSQYETLEVGAQDRTVPVVISLPESATSAYQGKTCTISYKVEAIQGNADIVPTPSNVFEVYNAFDWMSFVKQADANTLDDAIDTVKLINNVNLSGIEYGAYALNLPSNSTFTIDGNGCKIQNLNTTASLAPATGDSFYGAGLFAKVFGVWNTCGEKLVVKNLTVENASVAPANSVGGKINDVKGGAAVFIGETYAVKEIEFNNCSVVGCSAQSAYYVGSFVGYDYSFDLTSQKISIVNSSVKNSSFSGYSATAALIGLNQTPVTISGSEVSGNTIHGNGGYTAAALVGTANDDMIATVTLNNNTFSVNETKKASDFHNDVLGHIIAKGAYEVNGSVYCRSAHLRSVLSANNNVTLTKDYVVLDNWTPYKEETGSVYSPITGNFAIDGSYIDENNKTKCHTISGLTASLLAPNASKKISIKNLTIQNSTIIGYTEGQNNYCAGAFISYADNTVVSLSLENCHAVNVTAKTADVDISGISAGALVGYLNITGDEGVVSPSEVGVSITNCSATECTVSSQYGNAAGIVGMCATVKDNDNFKIENCNVKDCNITGEKATKTGTIIGTVNNGGTLYMDDCSVSGCTTGTNTTLTKVYGRIVDKDNMKTILNIDGTEYKNS